MNVADQVEAVRSLFAGHAFGPPCTEAEIGRAEAALGEPLPASLRQLYLAFNGFFGPTDARFLWPLYGNEGLVELNQFYRGDDLFPKELVTRCLFFGDGGLGSQWGLKRDLPDKVIRWDAEWDTDFEIAGDSLLEVWRVEKQLYETLGEV